MKFAPYGLFDFDLRKNTVARTFLGGWRSGMFWGLLVWECRRGFKELVATLKLNPAACVLG